MLQPLQPKRRSLARFEGAEAVLSYYPSGHFMAEHAHECDQRSMILSGGLFEETPSRTARPSASHIGFKAAGHKHENRYGPNGALILAVNAEPCSRPKTLWSWGPAAGAADAAHLVRLMLEDGAVDDQVLIDLMGVLGVHADPPSGCAPAWLSRVREAVRDDPAHINVQRLADEAGVHRVHLSRSYARFYGAPISLDRRRVRLSQAIRSLLEEGVSAAEAAQIGGFSDQPHLARTLRSETGLTATALKAVFA
ncbi:AraC family transcriptional regulator [Oceanicaulis sp.]|uniref:AraC family transcriptional regulator n=1 Tax=Oceanicaulis sp. TaxID=1924941 RepID=UPI003F725221